MNQAEHGTTAAMLMIESYGGKDIPGKMVSKYIPAHTHARVLSGSAWRTEVDTAMTWHDCDVRFLLLSRLVSSGSLAVGCLRTELDTGEDSSSVWRHPSKRLPDKSTCQYGDSLDFGY